MSDEGGFVRNNYAYSAFGQITSQSNSVTNTHQFAGEQIDPNGLSYNRARYYNPVTGRFISRDSVMGRPSDPTSLNRYAYAEGNPTSLIDPGGNVAFLALVGSLVNQAIAGAVIGGLIGGTIGYGSQVYNNFANNGYGLDRAFSTNIDLGLIGRNAAFGAVTGAVAGFAIITTDPTNPGV